MMRIVAAASTASPTQPDAESISLVSLAGRRNARNTPISSATTGWPVKSITLTILTIQPSSSGWLTRRHTDCSRIRTSDATIGASDRSRIRTSGTRIGASDRATDGPSDAESVAAERTGE